MLDLCISYQLKLCETNESDLNCSILRQILLCKIILISTNKVYKRLSILSSWKERCRRNGMKKLMKVEQLIN